MYKLYPRAPAPILDFQLRHWLSLKTSRCCLRVLDADVDQPADDVIV